MANASLNEFVVGIDEEEDLTSGAICKGLSVDYYRAKNRGVATNKNRLIKILYDRGCDYIFLLEDDLLIVGDFIKPYITVMGATKIPFMSGLHPELVEFPNSQSKFSILNSVKYQEFNIIYPSSCSNIFMVMTSNLIDKCGYFNTVQYKNKYGRIQTMWLENAKSCYTSEWIQRRAGWPDIKEGRDTYRYLQSKGGMSEEDKKKEVSAFRESYFKYHSRPLMHVDYPEEQIVLKTRSIDN